MSVPVRVRWAAVALTLGLLGALAIAGPSGAVVQPTYYNQGVNGISVTPNNGTVIFHDLGRNDGVDFIGCGGESPVGGPVIPGDVITNLRANETVLRILKSTATGNVAVTGGVTVEIWCTIHTPRLSAVESLQAR